MELKDMILSTLAELEEGEESIKKEEEKKAPTKEEKETLKKDVKKEAPKPLLREKSIEKEEETIQEETLIEESVDEEETYNGFEDERHFCESMRERILVLFEGFQSPNNKSIEAKVDLTLNFLEYLLAVIDERLEILDKKHK